MPISDNVETGILSMEALSRDWGECGRNRILVVVDWATVSMLASVFDSLSTDNVFKFLGTILATFGRLKKFAQTQALLLEKNMQRP